MATSAFERHLPGCRPWEGLATLLPSPTPQQPSSPFRSWKGVNARMWTQSSLTGGSRGASTPELQGLSRSTNEQLGKGGHSAHSLQPQMSPWHQTSSEQGIGGTAYHQGTLAENFPSYPGDLSMVPVPIRFPQCWASSWLCPRLHGELTCWSHPPSVGQPGYVSHQGLLPMSGPSLNCLPCPPQ